MASGKSNSAGGGGFSVAGESSIFATTIVLTSPESCTGASTSNRHFSTAGILASGTGNNLSATAAGDCLSVHGTSLVIMDSCSTFKAQGAGIFAEGEAAAATSSEYSGITIKWELAGSCGN